MPAPMSLARPERAWHHAALTMYWAGPRWRPWLPPISGYAELFRPNLAELDRDQATLFQSVYPTVMSGLNRRHLHAARKGLLGLVAGLWLFAAALPCVMAAPCPSGMDGPCPPGGTSGVPLDQVCDSLEAAACQISSGEHQLVRLPAADLELPAPIVPAITLPTNPGAATLAPLQRHPDQFALRLSPPPLYRQYSVYRI